MLHCENAQHLKRNMLFDFVSVFGYYNAMISMTNTTTANTINIHVKNYDGKGYDWTTARKKLLNRDFFSVRKLFFGAVFSFVNLNIHSPYYNLGVRMRSDIKLLLHR